MPKNFARLRAIVSQRGREEELSDKINQLEQLTNEWTEKAAEPEIAARREINKHPESLKDVAALLEAGTGKTLLDNIRAEFARFIEVEEELTAQRYAAASQATITTKKNNIVAGSFLNNIWHYHSCIDYPSDNRFYRKTAKGHENHWCR